MLWGPTAAPTEQNHILRKYKRSATAVNGARLAAQSKSSIAHLDKRALPAENELGACQQMAKALARLARLVSGDISQELAHS